MVSEFVVSVAGIIIATGLVAVSAVPAALLAGPDFQNGRLIPSQHLQMAGNTARPGHIAIKEEYDRALAIGTTAALRLFIARHPNSRWTAEARKRLQTLRKQGKD